MLGCVGRHGRCLLSHSPVSVSLRRERDSGTLGGGHQGQGCAIACIRGVQCDQRGWPSASPWTRGASTSVDQPGEFHVKTL